MIVETGFTVKVTINLKIYKDRNTVSGLSIKVGQKVVIQGVMVIKTTDQYPETIVLEKIKLVLV